MSTMQNPFRHKVRFLFPLVFCLGLGFSPGTNSSPEKGFVSIEEFKQELQTTNIDRIRDKLSTIRWMKYQGEILPLLLDLWEERQEKYPELSWRTIKSNIIKIEIANVLVQAESNRQIKLEKGNFRQFALSVLNTKDVAVTQVAILTLGRIDNPEDVNKLSSIAREEKLESNFKLAVIALIGMCSNGVEQALIDLEKEINNEQRRNFVERYKEKYKKRRERCSPR